MISAQAAPVPAVTDGTNFFYTVNTTAIDVASEEYVDSGDAAGWNALTEDRQEVGILANGSTVTAKVSVVGGGNLDVYFDDAIVTVSLPVNVALSVGTTNSVQENWLYVGPSGVVSNSTSRPSGERSLLFHIGLMDAAHVQAEGPIYVQRFTELVNGPDGRSKDSHMGERVRALGAQWISGAALGVTINVNGGAEDDLFLTTTAGIAWQMLQHIQPAITNTLGAIQYHILNDNGQITHITNLNQIANDSQGNAVLGSNNRWFNIEVGIVADSGNTNFTAPQVLILLSTDEYNDADQASTDAENFSVTTLEEQYRQTAVRLGTVRLRRQAAGGGTWTADVTDRRGVVFGTSGGGTGGAAGTHVFTDSQWTLIDNGDPTKKAQWECAEISTGTTRTYTHPDKSGTNALLSDITGSSTFLGLSDVDLETNRTADIIWDAALGLATNDMRPVVVVSKNNVGDQAINNATTTTITWETAPIDTHGGMNLGTEKYTFPRAGLWYIWFRGGWDLLHANVYAQCQIRLEGATSTDQRPLTEQFYNQALHAPKIVYGGCILDIPTATNKIVWSVYHGNGDNTPVLEKEQYKTAGGAIWLGPSN